MTHRESLRSFLIALTPEERHRAIHEFIYHYEHCEERRRVFLMIPREFLTSKEQHLQSVLAVTHYIMMEYGDVYSIFINAPHDITRGDFARVLEDFYLDSMSSFDANELYITYYQVRETARVQNILSLHQAAFIKSDEKM